MYSNDLPDMSEALRQVYEKNDGNLANNAPPYDKVTRRDVITGRLGKDEMGGKRKKHDCAKKVNYKAEEFDVIPEQHTMLEDGTVTHYDITNGETIVENVPVEELDILISEKHEHFDNYDKNAEVLGEGYGKKKKMKKEAFFFSDEELEELDAIDEATDEELIEFFEEIISEMAESEEDLLEICEALEEVELLDEDYYDSAVKASKAAAKKNRPSRVERMKSAAKAAGAKLKAGAKKVGKAVIGGAARAAGHAKGEFEAQRIKSKRAAMSRPEKKKEAPKSSSSDDGTGGKLDALLAKTRGTSSSSSSDSGSSSSGGGGSSSSSSGSSGSSSSGSTRKAVGGALRKVGSLVKKGVKKAVGKTARAVSSGSDKLAKRLGEDFDQIDHLYQSGLFSIQEIENVIEEGYKEIDQAKKNKMFRRAGNLSRDAISTPIPPEKRQDAHKKSGKIIKQLNKLNQEGK